MIKLHIFDMDGTLIDNDCDVSWKVFLVGAGLAPRSDLELAQKYYEDYAAGTLDSREFLHFQLREFIGRTAEEMAALCQRHFDEVVRAKCRPGAAECVRRAKNNGARTAILSSTNTMISEPVRVFFGIDQTCGTTLQLENGRFTGDIDGEYALGKNKIAFMRRLAADVGAVPEEVAAYGDSANDIPLLSAVGAPAAVAPTPGLEEEARKRNWPILSW